MPRGVYERKRRGKAAERKAPARGRVEIASPYCVIGAKVNPRGNYGDRKWFDDLDLACSHAAQKLLVARQSGDLNTDALFVVKVVRVVKPVDPRYEFLEVK